jgi:hypothetical protein
MRRDAVIRPAQMVAEGCFDPDERGEDGPDVIPESIYDENSVGPSLRPICALVYDD